MRTALGVALFLPLGWMLFRLVVVGMTAPSGAVATSLFVGVGSDLLVPLVLAWFGQRFLHEIQTITVEGPSLVVRRTSWVGPAYTRKIGLDRVRGRSFEVQTFGRDAADASFRPSFKARLMMRGDGDTALAWAGEALTTTEASEACAVLNRLVQNPVAVAPGSDDALM
jgi:hypothetical protein